MPKARETIEAAAARTVQRASDFKPFVFEGPATAEVLFVDPSYADTLEQLDFVTRVESWTIRLETQDYLKVFERFNALHFLGPVVR